MIRGQKNLLNTIDNMISAGKLPHFVVIMGSIGSGRATITKYIADKLEAELKVVEELKIDKAREVIDDSRALSFRKLYLFRDVDSMSDKVENSLLKLAEEPTDLCYIVMTVENTSNLLPTMLSRAKVLKMDEYTKEELKMFTNRDDLLSMCNTPGMIKMFENQDATATLSFADKIVNNVDKVSLMNMLTILTYIDIDGKDEDKYNVRLILKAMENNIYNKMIETKEQKYLDILKKIQETRRGLSNPSINKQACFDDLLFSMRGILKNEG